jgi:uncharacterized protein (TIGR02118 family)
MTKLIALYKTPEDKEAFEKKYFEEHIPLVNKMPGLIKAEISKLKGIGSSEEKFYMQAVMYFNDMDALNAAMGSPEGRASAKNLMSFAQNIVTMYIGEDVES